VYDRFVIDSGQLVNGLWMGSVLILLALAPESVQRCLEAIEHSVIARGLRPFPFLPRTPVAFAPPRWLAWAGVAVWVIAVLAYTS
jgi:hypothetical protein